MLRIESLPQLIAFFTNVLLCYFVLKSQRKKINIIYFFFSMCVAVWTACAVLLFYPISESFALLVGRILHMGVLFMPALYFHFVCLLIEKQRMARFINTGYILAGMFFLLNATGNLVVGIKHEYYGYYSVGAKGVYTIFSLYVISFILTSLMMIIRESRTENYRLKNQLKILMVGTGIALAGGITDLMPVMGLTHYPFTNIPFYRLGSFCVGIYGALVAYSIIKHRLMGIEVIIRNTLVFAGLLAFVFAIFSAGSLFVKVFLHEYLNVAETYANILSIAIIVFAYDPLRRWLINTTDKVLFQKKYDYHKVLKDASRGMSKIESLNHLLGLVIHFITMKMRVRNAAILTYDEGKDVYSLGFQRGYKKKRLSLILSKENPMIHHLIETHEPLELEQLKNALEEKISPKQAIDFRLIIEEMEKLDARCVIPSLLGQELKNILILGEKKSGAFYTEEDLNLLMTLAQESSIAIENARLYDEAIKKQKQLQQINEQLEYSKSMLVKALAQAEGANKQLQDTQAQLIHEQKMATLGRLAASVGHEVNNPLTILSMNVSRAILKHRKNPSLLVSEIVDIFDKMEKNIERIKAVVNTLTGLLKKSEKGKFEPLSLKLILEETLPLVQFQTYMDNLSGTEVELNVPGNVPLIRGDLERLQEIFLNLFINAYHAMATRRHRKITVNAEPCGADFSMVAVHFRDNGSGMSEETMKKIFNYGFTTKPPGRGSGMGLYMCKYIIELHGGTISVQSREGEGTTFTVTLPVYEDSARPKVTQS